MEVRRFDSEDAAKVYLMSRISGSGIDFGKGLLLFAEGDKDVPGAQIILVGGGTAENL